MRAENISYSIHYNGRSKDHILERQYHVLEWKAIKVTKLKQTSVNSTNLSVNYFYRFFPQLKRKLCNDAATAAKLYGSALLESSLPKIG